MEELDKEVEKQSREVRRLIKVTTFNTDIEKMQHYLILTCGNLTQLEKLYVKKIEQKP